MRTWVVASAFALIVAGCSLYAVVGSPFARVKPKADVPVDKVLLFFAPKNIPHAPAEDLIATKLAIQPVISPDLPKVQQEKKPAPPKKQQAKTKPKPKKPVTVTGSL